MGLAERRKALGYSQEKLAELLGVDRTTVGRWESGRIAPQPLQRRRLSDVLELSLDELDAFLTGPRTAVQEPATRQPGDQASSGVADDMIRREFLRILSISGALTALPVDEAAALTAGVRQGVPADFTRMNSHLWQVYQLARSKGSVYPVIRDQMTALNQALAAGRGISQPLLHAAADIFQLAGEVSFDANRYADAAASYALAASVGREAGAYDLWACALVRHAYVEMSEYRYDHAVQMLAAADRLAARGDSHLSTRHWVASVQAQAYAGVGDLNACERALNRAEEVNVLPPGSANGGWLRFDGSRLAEERGARYVQLGRLDLAKETLERALGQAALASGHSYRRRGTVLSDLAAIGAERGDRDQVLAYGREALRLAQDSSSGYVVRRLKAVCSGFGPLNRDHRVAQLAAEVAELGTA